MQEEFWREKWRAERRGWSQSEPHPMLVRHLGSLGLEPGARVFVPLCGDTIDIHRLLADGFRVVGAELVEAAVRRLFSALGIEPEVSDLGTLKRFSGERTEVFVGDLFALDADTLGPIDAIYDRAALVALPAETRGAYAAHLAKITGGAPQLLVTFDYDQSQIEGPPFSVTEQEVRALYAGLYGVEVLETAELAGGLKGRCPANEIALRLTKR